MAASHLDHDKDVGCLPTNAGPEQNGNMADAEDADQVFDGPISLLVNMPHEPKTLTIMVSPHEQFHEVRQSIIDLPVAFRYTCFHLEYQGKRVNDFLTVAEITGSIDEAEVTLVEDAYTEKEARIHFVRIRELIGAAGDRTDFVQGVLPGLSLLDSLESCAEPVTFGEKDFSAKDTVPGASASMNDLLPRVAQSGPSTIKSCSLSPWNPAPCYLRQRGHLLYLVITTNEGDQFHITSHIGGFYVNKSSNSKFDPNPRPAPKGQSVHSLLTLLGLISPSFETAFSALQNFNNRRDPLATFQIANAMPAAPWVVPPVSSPHVTHVADPARSQETYLIAGADNTDTLRDWNEEFQSTRELPRSTVQDRVYRERLLSRLFADYTDAATRGAVLVARGEIAPLNPMESQDAQIFVYNNIFFSVGADGVGTFLSEGGDEAARVATAKDVAGVRLVNQLDIDGLFTTATVVVDYLGKRIVAQSIVPGIFKPRDAGDHQIDYGAAEGKELVAADERFVNVFKKLSRALKVKKHPVWDKNGERVDLETSLETKGLLGTDGRKYVLDLYRITPLDIGWLEWSGDAPEYPHRMTVLRPELIESYGRKKMKEWMDAELVRPEDTSQELSSTAGKLNNTGTASTHERQGGVDSSSSSPREPTESLVDPSSKFTFSLNPDAFSGLKPRSREEKAELEADESEVRLVCQYLTEQVIPTLVHELENCEISFPMDGQSLSRLLHKRGINIRYLGKVASSSTDARLACLRDACVQDMVSRAFKHIASAHLRKVPPPVASSCISHLLNCLLGFGLNSFPRADVSSELKALYTDSDFSFEAVTPESLRADIKDEVAKRFRHQLDEGWWYMDVKPFQMLREVSLKLGLQIQAKDYKFITLAVNDASPHAEPGANGRANGEGKKKKKKSPDTPTARTISTDTVITFSPDDIINIVPIVRHSTPRSALAEEALEAGRISILQSQKKLGQELLIESLSLHEQIYGILHPEVARVYNSLSMLYYQLDEKETAIELAKKAIIVSERTVGVDSAETLLNYLNLSLFLHQAGNSKSAMIYLGHALRLWNIVHGAGHPDIITTINNGAVMLQHLKQYSASRLWFEESLRICQELFGKASINAATLLFQLAQALALDQDSKGSVNRMRESYNIFLAELGPDDKNTKEAENWLEQLTQNAVSIAKHAKDLQIRQRSGVRFAHKRDPLESVHQNLDPSAARKQGLHASSSIDPRNIDDLIKFIEGADQAITKVARTPGPGKRK